MARSRNVATQGKSFPRRETTEELPQNVEKVLTNMLSPSEVYRLNAGAETRVAIQSQKLRRLELDDVVSVLTEIFSNLPNKHARYAEKEVVDSLRKQGDACWSAASLEQLISVLNRLENQFDNLDLSTIAEDEARRSIDERLRCLQSQILGLQVHLKAEQGNTGPLRARLPRRGTLATE